MKKYLAVAVIHFKAQIVYRFDVSMSALTTIGRVLLAWILWGAVFTGRENVGGFTFNAMFSYYLVSAFLASLDMSDGVSAEVSTHIRGGTFSRFMVIPTSPQLHFLAQNFGTAGYYALFTALAALCGGVMFGVRLVFTGDAFSLLCAVAMIPLGLVFMVSLQFLIGVLTFRFQDIGFFWYLQRNIVAFVTGTLFPLSLLPKTVMDVFRFLPFTYVTYTPTMLLTGQTGWEDGLLGLSILAVWTAGMLMLSGMTYRNLRVKYDGVGV